MFYTVCFISTVRLVFHTGLAIQLHICVGQAIAALRTGSGSLTYKQVFCVAKQ